MKKLFSLLTLALLTMSAWAGSTVTFDYTQDQGTWTAAGEFSVTKENVTLAFSNGTINGAYRVYANSTLTISSASEENITKIQFTCTSGNPASNFDELDGFNTATGVWTGDAQSVEFKAHAQVRATQIEVTLGEGGDTPVDPDPVVKTYVKVTSADQLVAGQKYIIVDEEAPYAMASIGNNGGLGTSVTINSGIISTADALELTLGGTVNAASFSYDNNGTTTYMKAASKSLSTSTDEYAEWVIDTENFTLSAMIGTDEFTLRYNSNATSGPFRCYSTSTGRVVYLYVYDENATPVEPVENEIGSLEILADMANDVNFTFTGNAYVSAQKGNYLWLRDDTGYGLIFGYNNPTFVPGTELNPGWKATTSIYNGLMEFTNATGLDSIGFDAAYAEPQTITALDADMLNAYVQVLNVKSFAVSGRNVTATLADGTTMVMYNQFNNEVTVPTTEGDYTVLGAVSTHNGLQLMILSIEGNFVVAPTLPAACSFEGSKTIEITCNDEDATVMYGYDGTTWTEYTEALTITASTTVYAKAVKGDIESEVVSATYTLVDPATMVTYTLVTDVNELADGDKIIFVGFHNVDSVTVQPYAMAHFKTNNFAAEAVTMVDNTITTGLANVVTLEANGDNWNFLTDGGYLYANGSDTDNGSQNYLKLQDEVDAYATAAITMADDITVIEFQGGNDSRFMRFNDNNTDNILFSCYKETSSVKNPVYIFKAKAAAGLRGDVDNSGNVDISDATALINYLLYGNSEGLNMDNANCDLTGGIDISDATTLINYLLYGTW